MWILVPKTKFPRVMYMISKVRCPSEYLAIICSEVSMAAIERYTRPLLPGSEQSESYSLSAVTLKTL